MNVVLPRNGGANSDVIPNIHDVVDDHSLSFEDRSRILFIGSYLHPPNVDAVRWLCEEIMPIIWEFDRKITLTLLGVIQQMMFLIYEMKTLLSLVLLKM